MPVAAPAGAPPVPSAVPATARAGSFDVELLPAPPRPAARARLVPTARDWFFLGLGAGGVILAGLIGFALAWLLRG